MLARQSNAGRIFGETVTEFIRPKWSSRELGQSSAGNNEPSIVCPGNLCNNQKMSFTEVHGDLFTSSDSLVHCVSRDLHMGKGIAAEFKKQFGGVDELRQQNVGVGEVAVLKRNNRYIYYLVTKVWYFDKPTLGNLRHSLECTRAHCQKYGVTRLAMPRIGCGLDKLNWPDVTQLLDEIFVNSGITVTVFSL